MCAKGRHGNVRILSIAPLAAAAVCAALGGAWANAVERFAERGVLSVCHDPYIYPYSAQGMQPPGFDVDIARRIAEMNGLRLEQVWVDTGTRGGLGRALRNSIGRGACAVFTGIAIDDEQIDELAEKDLVASAPYMGAGYLLVAQGEAAAARSLEDLKGTRIGVAMATAVDGFLFNNGYERGLYLGNRRVARGMVEGEIDAALIFATSLSAARREYPDHEFTVIEGFETPAALRWNIAFAIRGDAPDIIATVNASLAELIESGEMAAIVGAYGIPWMAPLAAAEESER